MTLVFVHTYDMSRMIYIRYVQVDYLTLYLFVLYSSRWVRLVPKLEADILSTMSRRVRSLYSHIKCFLHSSSNLSLIMSYIIDILLYYKMVFGRFNTITHRCKFSLDLSTFI